MASLPTGDEIVGYFRPIYRNLLQGLSSCWDGRPFGHNIDMGRKERSAVPLSGGGELSLHPRLWPGPRPTSVPSFVLIHPTVWSQRYRQTGQQTGQRSDRVGRTVLQTVAQKLEN